MFRIYLNTGLTTKSERFIYFDLAHTPNIDGFFPDDNIFFLKKVKVTMSTNSCNTFANMAEDMMEVDLANEDIILYGRLVSLIDDDMDDLDLNADDNDAFRYQRPRSCWVRPWLLRRYEERPPTLFGLIQEIEAVSILNCQ